MTYPYQDVSFDGRGGTTTISSSRIETFGGNLAQNHYSGPTLPGECSNGCILDASRVRILFWPVDENNSTGQNVSTALGSSQYTTVSDGFTFTSPSVYVAYENLGATTDYIRYDLTHITGQLYNTTVAYRPDALSTFACFNEDGNYQPINYTKLQYPPPNSALTDCYFEDGWGGNPNQATWSVGASPTFSIPPGLTELVPSWSSCKVDVQDGVMDPPRTLSRATAMAPMSNSSPAAAPAAQITPANAPATPTPSPKFATSKDPQTSDPPNSDGQPINDNPPAHSDTPNNGASVNHPSNQDPSSYDPPDNIDFPKINPSSNDAPSSDEFPGQAPSIDLPSSTTTNTGLFQSASSSQDPTDKDSPLGDPNEVSGVQSWGLGALIANAFKNVPSSNQEIASQVLGLSTAGMPMVHTPAIAIPDIGPTPMTVGDDIFTPNPSAFAVHGTTISAGGPGVVIDGTSIDLQPSGSGLVIGSSTVNVIASQAPTPNVVTVGDQVFTPSPNGFLIDGTSLLAGRPSITIDGTAISLQSSGMELVIGSSTLALFSQASTAASAITVGSVIITPNPTAFSIAGTSIWAGGPGVTIDGTLISFHASGAGLVVGSSMIEIAGTAVKSAGRDASASLTTGSDARNVGPTSGAKGTAPSSSATQESQIASSGGPEVYSCTRGLSLYLVAGLVAVYTLTA